MKKENLLNTLKAAEEKQHYIIEKASIDKIFLKQSENFINLKQHVAISIWFEEECTFSILKEGGFILHKPSGDLIFSKQAWSDLCRKTTVWLWGNDIYCNSEEMKNKLIDLGFITYNS